MPSAALSMLSIPRDFTPTGLRLPADLSADALESLLRTIGNLGRANQWWAGDALLYAEEHFGERLGQLSEALGWTPATVHWCMLVAKRFPPERRRPELEFAHHADLKTLEPREADTYLLRAALGDGQDERWSVARLREALREDGHRPVRAQKAQEGPSEPKDGDASLPVAVIPPGGAVAMLGALLEDVAAIALVCKPETTLALEQIRGLIEQALAMERPHKVVRIPTVSKARTEAPALLPAEWASAKWPSAEAFAEAWNLHTPDTCPSVEALSPNRRKLIARALKVRPHKSWWEECYREFHRSRFLKCLVIGTNGHANFKPDFDWFLGNHKGGVENYVRIHDGAYQD